LKAVYRVVLSSVETMRAFNSGFDTVNLHRPTFAAAASPAAFAIAAAAALLAPSSAAASAAAASTLALPRGATSTVHHILVSSAETRHAFNYVTFRVLTALMHVQRNFVALDEGFSTHQVTGSAAQNPGRRYSFKIPLSKFPINMIETKID
jgi:hypothetical protein